MARCIWTPEQRHGLRDRIETLAAYIRMTSRPDHKAQFQHELSVCQTVWAAVGEDGVQIRRLTPEQEIWAWWLYWYLAARAHTKYAPYAPWLEQIDASHAFVAQRGQDRDRALAALNQRQQNTGAAAPKGQTYGTRNR